MLGPVAFTAADLEPPPEARAEPCSRTARLGARHTHMRRSQGRIG